MFNGTIANSILRSVAPRELTRPTRPLTNRPCTVTSHKSQGTSTHKPHKNDGRIGVKGGVTAHHIRQGGQAAGQVKNATMLLNLLLYPPCGQLWLCFASRSSKSSGSMIFVYRVLCFSCTKRIEFPRSVPSSDFVCAGTQGREYAARARIPRPSVTTAWSGTASRPASPSSRHTRSASAARASRWNEAPFLGPFCRCENLGAPFLPPAAEARSALPSSLLWYHLLATTWRASPFMAATRCAPLDAPQARRVSPPLPPEPAGLGAG